MAVDETSVTVRDLYCIETLPDPCGLVIFGASGDLTSRKLIPSLFSLHQKGLIGEDFFVVGCGRTPLSDDEFRRSFVETLAKKAGNRQRAEQFLDRCFYVVGKYAEDDLYRALGRKLEELEARFRSGGNRLFYLSVPPALYTKIVEHLAGVGLLEETHGRKPWRRVVVEKPFGYDLVSSQQMNVDMHRFIDERQIYRIDHYLGKDTVQNLFIFRFANAVFEPIWNRRYIDHVQITVAESIGVEHRAGYFEKAGLFRDMFQNHMLAMLALVAMEPPIRFEAQPLRDETAKLLRSIKPWPTAELDRWVVRGQYAAGQAGGQPVPGYLEEHGVDPASRTETFTAARVMIDNWRWRGVPFYLRSGKRLAKKISQIAIEFKSVPHSVFEPLREEDLTPNVLVLNVQPEEGMALTIQAKRPGPKLCMSELTMSFKYREAFGGEPPEAYERLLLDAMAGEQTLFVRFDALEAAWGLITPVLETWARESAAAGDLHRYTAGGWGPKAADTLLARDGRQWREL